MRWLRVLLLAAAVQRPDASAAYHARIDAYRSGDATGGSDATQPAVDLDVLGGWTSVDLQAAAMLETDAGLRLLKADRRPDARVDLERAAELLRMSVTKDPTRAEYAVRWRDTVAGLLEAFGAADIATDLDTRGHNWWPASKEAAAAEPALTQGLAHEIQAAVAGRLSGPPPTRPFAIPPDAASALRQAAADYTSALTSDAGNALAALHLGRVLLLLGRDGEAIPRLRAAASGPNPSVRYLALLFAGAADERAGRLDAALEQYRAAAGAFRWGQSAPLALSHALMRAGRETDARHVLTDHFTATHDRVCEPLWTYLADPSTDLGPTLDELRAEIWR